MNILDKEALDYTNIDDFVTDFNDTFVGDASVANKFIRTMITCESFGLWPVIYPPEGTVRCIDVHDDGHISVHDRDFHLTGDRRKDYDYYSTVGRNGELCLDTWAEGKDNYVHWYRRTDKGLRHLTNYHK